MSKKSFLDIITEARSSSDVKTGSPLPAGTYELEIVKANPEAVLRFAFGDFPEGTPCLEVFFRPVAPISVDEEALEDCEDWREQPVSLRFLSSSDATRFMDIETNRGLVCDAGLNPADYDTPEGIDLEGICADLKGRHVLGIVTHSPNKKDPERPYVNLKRTAALV